jgi:G3E family GTPase
VTDRVPLTILTGFLGAGKTTALNRLLGAAGGRRIAVLVNDLGAIDIDKRLIERQSGDVLELAGGCVCCKIDLRRDLWVHVRDLVDRSRADHIVLETTGAADPGAILELPPEIAARAAVVGVVAVVDAETGGAALERHVEARAQVEVSERVLLSKTDVAAPDGLGSAHRRVREINGAAEVAAFVRGHEGDMFLSRWLLEKRRNGATPGARLRKRRHGQLVAATFVDERPMVGALVSEWLARLGPSIVRAKGFVNLAGQDRRAWLEVAGARVTLAPAAPWGDDTRMTELVVIGEGLDDESLKRQLWACAAS